MPMTRRRPARRLAEPRGAILLICLMLMLITAILAGIILFLSRMEGTISASTRGNIQATSAAEYGIEFAINSLDPAQTTFTPFPTQVLNSKLGLRATAGLRNGAAAAATNTGVSPCPAGYSLTLACSGYVITATGWAQGWLAPQASTQLQTLQAIYQGCRGTDYTCQ